MRLLNYRANGTPFVNDLTVTPVVDPATRATTHFVGTVRERSLPGVQISRTAGASPAMIEQQAPREATRGTVPPPPRLPTHLQDSLQHEVPYPQMITERLAPFKTIHVNAAFCRQCGYRADEVVGRPYSLLFGPQTSQELPHALQEAFAAGRQTSCQALYYTKSMEPWSCQLTVAPLMDSTSTAAHYFVHALLPVSDTTGSAASVASAVQSERSAGFRQVGVAAAASGSSHIGTGGAREDSSRAQVRGSSEAQNWKGLGGDAGSSNGRSSNGSLGNSSSANGGSANSGSASGSADGDGSANGDDSVSTENGSALADDDASGDESPRGGRKGARAGASTGASSHSQGTASSAAAAPEDGGAASRQAEAWRGAEGQRCGAQVGPAPNGMPMAAGSSCAPAHVHVPAHMQVGQAQASLPPVGGAAMHAQAHGVAMQQAMLQVSLEARSAAALRAQALAESGMWGVSQMYPHGAPFVGALDPAVALTAGFGANGAMSSLSLQPPTSIALAATATRTSGTMMAGAQALYAQLQETGSANSDDGSGSGNGSGSTSTTAATVGHHIKGAGSTSGARVPPFLTKLYTIVDDAQPEDYAAWCSDGRSFRISDPQKFADRCLPRFFKHNKLGSFQQQLLTYGFQRVPNESCLDISSVWQHPNFRRGRVEQLEYIQRSTSKRPLSAAPAAAEHGEEEGEGEEGMSAAELQSVKEHVYKLSRSVDELRGELRAARASEMRTIETLVRSTPRRRTRTRP